MYRLPPGPVGTSCFTCKRRHKKCDMNKPICNRCLKGGYECLGYEHNKRMGCIGTDDEPLLPDSTRMTYSSSLPSGSSTASCYARSIDNPQNDEPFVPSDTVTILDIHKTSGRNEYIMSPRLAPVTRQPSDLLTRSGADSTIHEEPPATSEAEALPLCYTTNTAVSLQPLFPSDAQLFAFATQIPQSVPLPPDVRDTVEYVMSRIDRILNVTYFKPQGKQIARFRRDSAWRLSTCDFARQGMLIYAKIRDSILEGSDSSNGPTFVRWIDGHEQVLSASLDQSLTPCEHQERYHDILEIFYVKVSVFNAATTYQLMCQLAPTFLRMVYSEPTFWSDKHNPALVSMAHVFSSPRYGPAGYMLMDIVASMIYGIPHLVEYSTEVEPFHTEVHSAEWMNCIPGEILILLAKINICRDQGLLAEDWRNIEKRLVSWEPRPRFKPEGLDSDKSVAWMALQEAWRHTLLTYLYLALCGAHTDDQRIQSSLRQIFRLIGTIKRQNSPVANVHFFPQYLIAGICSRTEKHRRIVRERLGSVAETSFWLFRGPDIIPVLDHLWLGAAIDGRPITWNDYIHSRLVMLPLSSEAD
ncbi:hypothetical protein OPQ81_000329 [Rhizoctonia solani]|nr:hypothetical protein OPQ81_000329 [Rhizoctonia solani]